MSYAHGDVVTDSDSGERFRLVCLYTQPRLWALNAASLQDAIQVRDDLQCFHDTLTSEPGADLDEIIDAMSFLITLVSAHHAVGVMDDIKVGDLCPLCNASKTIRITRVVE